jgi:FKBP-type peptidyl-prolyl cis-trans isomerase SlyD
MQISANTVVTIDYKVSDTDNNLVDPGQEPIVFLHGTGGIFPKIEAALLGKSVGDALEIALEPADAFGDYNDDNLIVEALSNLPAGAEVGMQLEAHSAEGTRLLTITSIEDGKVVLDGNHPLAGVSLVFACTVSDVRAATAEEIEHGHAHGEGGHHH